MGRYCCVPGCKNTDRVRPGQKRQFKRFLKFYAFRSVPQPRQQLWLNAINRKEADGTPWKPGQYSNICSEHFVGGQASPIESHPNYLPTIFPATLPPGTKWVRHQSFPSSATTVRDQIDQSLTCSPDISYPAESNTMEIEDSRLTPSSNGDDDDELKTFDVKKYKSTMSAKATPSREGDGLKGFDVKKYNTTITAYSKFWKFVSNKYPDLDIKPIPKWKIPPEPKISREQLPREAEQLVKLNNSDQLSIPLLRYGWKREIVCRTSNSPDLTRRRMFDVYYYNPEGRKLRSSTQIADYLGHDTDLHVYDNFSFSKGLVGCSSDLEWVREAKAPLKSGKVDKPRTSRDGTPTFQEKPIKKISVNPNPRKRKRSKDVNLYEEDNDLDLGLSPDWLPTNSSTTREDTLITCSILCKSAMGCIPTLQCTKCLCLYHPQCMGLDPDNQIRNYLCTNCKKKIKAEQEKKKLEAANKPEVILPDKGPPPIGPAPSKVLTFTSKLQPSHLSLKKGNKFQTTNKLLTGKSILSTNTTLSNMKTINITPKTKQVSLLSKPLRPLAPVPSHNNLTNVIRTPTFTSAKEEPMQSIIQLGNKKFIAIPKCPLTAVGPPMTPSAKKVSENQLPPANTKSSLGGSYMVTNPPSMSGLIISVPTSSQYLLLNNNKVQTILPKPGSKDETQSSAKKSPSTASMKDMLSVGSNGMTVLINVFKHLQFNDLLKAAQVNRLFYAASRHYTLWRTVHLKNVFVTDWEKLARTLDKNDTEKINFNRMISRTDSEEVKTMWRSINQALNKISTLRHLEMGKCAGPEISILKQCPHMTHFSCLFNKKSVLDFYGFSQIQNLTQLYIRGLELNKMIGLKVLNIHVLSKLKHLTHLALTSVKQSTQDTNWAMFLGDMTQLEHLELGECTNFTDEFVRNALSKLINLKRLRLEMVTELIANDVLTTVATFPQLDTLELINFDVKPGFEEALGSCVNLRHVLIIPTYIKQSAVTVQRMLIALSNMNTILTKVVWGLTMELLKVTEMLVTQHDFPIDPSIDCTTCIPIMPKIRLAMGNTPEAKRAVQVEVIPVSQLKEMLAQELSQVDVKLIIVPYVKTLRQFLAF